MPEIRDDTTVAAAFAAAVQAHAGRPFLAVPANEGRPYLPAGLEMSYGEAGQRVEELAGLYRRAGYGVGHRVATLLENRPEHVLHTLALNTIGVCCVPINPDYRAAEIAYLIDHGEPDLVLTLEARQASIEEALALSVHRPRVVVSERIARSLEKVSSPARDTRPVPETPASILYTSGTTGRPKGCVLSHGYVMASGAWYASLGGVAGLRTAQDRIYNPLPLYHANAGVVSLMGAILTGNCQIQPDRFHPQRWWREVAETGATIVHYLGVIAPVLLKLAPGEDERRHKVRFGIGAGIEPELHAAFEQRFGFPMIELWGMTEMVRVLGDTAPPRQVGTRAFGRAVPGVEVRVVDDADRDVADGQPGEMLVRHSAATPRRGCFAGYLKDDAATEAAWQGGWFHTGDVVWRGPDGMLHFVERKKNIIRRSGENIAAAEVEAVLLAHPDVQQVAVMAVKDEMRDEEVLACVVLKREMPETEAATALFQHCNERLAYYKPPGWVHIVQMLPTTGTQKIQKHNIYPAGTDPRALPGIIDLRSLKRRHR
ncbi:MAG: AMP-binding protein [Reyranella sp.]|uniref:AMP-binding protein n=1 Tax=Reyranella sp. TaxID=1929291 RepID=UPI002730358C|nr:AMP-binding protein [Reyranella sp.]MDP1965526.1 AMP-binding protein [Reyranella sp.]MDP2375283.1 AMP-binding protein [Reyranella sp.]